ncbi:MAG: rhomboid family intramembrane serine protease [Planctomycetota bacterium]
MLLIPYGTDAPVYHMPIATGVTIGINVVVFILQCVIQGDTYELTDMLVMNFGELNPIRWFTCVYAHGGVMHLLGNMSFLFIFGIIVEGKIGWWRFVLLYNALGYIASVLIAIVMIWSSGGSALGATCAIFGLMAVAMVWAPENEIQMMFFTVFFLRPIYLTLEVSVLALAFFFIALNLVIAFFSEFEMSSETAHLLGVVPGLVAGCAFVVLRQVDCDGYDLIAILRGKRGERVKTIQQEQEEAAEAEEEERREKEEFDNGWKTIQRYLNDGHFDMATKRFEMLKRKNPGLVMPEQWYVQLIRGHSTDGLHNEKSARLMEEYLQNYETLKVPVTLNLARFYIVEQERPRKGIGFLKGIKASALDQRQAKTFNALAKHAKRLIADGVIELDD